MNVRFILVACLLLIAMSQSGCIALNVPSQRYHDPTDGGGILGSWSNKPGSHPHPSTCVADQETNDGLMDGEFGIESFDSLEDSRSKPKPPEIPWPRFHPVPTRPVFGPASL